MKDFVFPRQYMSCVPATQIWLCVCCSHSESYFTCLPLPRSHAASLVVVHFLPRNREEVSHPLIAHTELLIGKDFLGFVALLTPVHVVPSEVVDTLEARVHAPLVEQALPSGRELGQEPQCYLFYDVPFLLSVQLALSLGGRALNVP